MLPTDTGRQGYNTAYPTPPAPPAQPQPFNPYSFIQPQYDLSRQGAQNTYDIGMARNQLNQSAIPRQLQFQDVLGRLSQQQFGLQRQSAMAQSDIANRGLTSSSTANDSLQSQGTRQGFGDIKSALANQLSNIDVNSQQQTAQTAEAKAQLNDQAKGYGITGQELQKNLDNALSQLGLNKLTDSNQIAQGLKGLSPQDQDLIRQFMDYAVTYGQYSPKNGINPQMLTPDMTVNGY